MAKFFTFTIGAIFCGTAGYFFWFHTESACNIKNGHWASNGSYCITRNCYATNSCGNWANPIQHCSTLKIGVPISEVYFQLGQPDNINGNIYTWHSYKADPGKINATINSGILQAINCNAI